MKLTLPGTGSAGGIPLFGCRCEACERARSQPEFARESACAEIAIGDKRILIDAGIPDIHRRYTAGELEHILLTHYHMDHVQGLFPMRWGNSTRVALIGPDDPKGADDLFKHPGIFDLGRKASPFESFTLEGISITPLPLNHSRPCIGYHLSHEGFSVAYLTDTLGLPDETLIWLNQNRTDVMIIDCSYPPSGQPINHNDLTRAIGAFEASGTRRCILTHISDRMEAWLIRNPNALPSEVTIARDGLVVQTG